MMFALCFISKDGGCFIATKRTIDELKVLASTIIDTQFIFMTTPYCVFLADGDNPNKDIYDASVPEYMLRDLSIELRLLLNNEISSYD